MKIEEIDKIIEKLESLSSVDEDIIISILENQIGNDRNALDMIIKKTKEDKDYYRTINDCGFFENEIEKAETIINACATYEDSLKKHRGRLPKVSWDDAYAILEHFYLENGHILIMNQLQYQGLNLGKWLSDQRTKYKKGKLTEEQIQKLENLGIIWNTKTDDGKAQVKEIYENLGIEKFVIKDGVQVPIYKEQTIITEDDSLNMEIPLEIVTIDNENTVETNETVDEMVNPQEYIDTLQQEITEIEKENEEKQALYNQILKLEEERARALEESRRLDKEIENLVMNQYGGAKKYVKVPY